MAKTFLDKHNNRLVTVYETSEIVANPTLTSGEPDLTSLQIGNSKFRVPSGGGGGSYTAGNGIEIDANNEISVDETVVAVKDDIPTLTSQLTNDSGFITSVDLPTNHVTTNTTQAISGLKIFTNSSGIQSRSSSTSVNKVILDGTSTDYPHLVIQKGGSKPDSISLYPGTLIYSPANGSNNKTFKIQSAYEDGSSKIFTYEFTAPTYTDVATTYTVATTADIPDIEANPVSTTETLLGIGINGVNYSVAGSSDLDITAQEIAAYFEEYCTVEASVDDNILDLTNVDLENETNYTALDFNSSNVSAGNKILEIN